MMIDWIKSKIFRKKVVDARAFLGVDWGGHYADAYRRVPSPTKSKLINEYKGLAYICANYNSRVVFSTSLRLYRKLDKNEKCRWKTKQVKSRVVDFVTKSNRINLSTGERIEEVVDHPGLDLLHRPNLHMTGLRLLEFCQLYQEMVGEAAIRVIYRSFDGGKIPVAMFLLQPQFLKAEEDPDTGFVDHYSYGTKSPITLMPDEVVRFVLPNLSNPYLCGFSPLTGVFEDVNILDLYKATEAAVLSNEGRPDVLVSAKDGLGDPERFEKRFTTKFRRGGKAGIMFAEDDVSVVPLSWSPKDLAFTKVGTAAKEIIALAYGIPPALLDETGATQYNVDNTLSNRHIINAIKPRLERNLDTWNNIYLPLWDDSGKLFFAYDDPSVVNKEQALDEDCRLLQVGAISPNEVRVSRGYKPMPWGDDPVGMYQGNKKPSEADKKPVENETEGIETDEEAAREGNLQATGLNGAQIQGLLQVIESITSGVLTPMAGQLVIRTSFPLLDEELISNLVAELGKAKPQPNVQPIKSKCSCKSHPKPLTDDSDLVATLRKFFKRQKKDILTSLRMKSKALPSKFVPLKEWDRELFQKSQPLIGIYLTDAYDKRAKSLIADAGASPDVFSTKNPHVQDKVKALALRFCKETNATTTDELDKALADLRGSLGEGMDEGERFSQLVDRVEAVFDRAESERAELIAHTESSRAYVAGNLQSAKDSGVVKGQKVLLSSGACELCQQIAAQGEMGLDDNWYTDPNAPDEYQDKPHPPFHPECFCDLEFVLSDGGDEGGE